MLGGGALAVLVITGLFNYARLDHENDYKRYFITLQIKLTMVAVVVVLTILHGAVFGRKLQQLQESNAAQEEIARARKMSMYASIGTMVLSVAILLCAAILGSEWSKSGGLR
jgi:Mn2+/Fe2+ NRAMP family transporter